MITPQSEELLRSSAISDPYLTLIEIVTSELTFRITDDPSPITFENSIYQSWPVRLTLGQSGIDRQPSAFLQISNVSQTLAALLRSITIPPTCNIRIVRVSQGEYVTFNGEVVTYLGEPVTFGGPIGGFGVRAVELELLGLQIVSVDFNAQAAACRLGPRWDWTKERCPYFRHDGRFVGLWL